MDIQVRVVGKMKIDESKRLILDHSRLQGADFSGRKLMQLSSVGSKLEACRFDKVRIDDASFGSGRETSEYVECIFDGARMRLGPGGYTRFVRCSFRDVDLRDWFCFTVELIDCTFSGRLRRSWFNGTVPEEARAYAGRERNEFHGNDFSAMALIDVDFRTGIDLTQQRLPSGPEYIYLSDAAAAIGQARADVIHWSDLDLRRRGLSLIKTLEEGVAAGQRQLLLRPADFAVPSRKAADAMFARFRGGSPG